MAGNFSNNRGGRGGGQESGSNRTAAEASHIGESFHNPYTFIPFPDKVTHYLPTAITADELSSEMHRKSGVLELDVKTMSPLMTCSPVPVSEKNEHKTFKALNIGNDIVLPSTGVRGALRTLMTIISGGTLGYMDEDLWLTQGRDAQLGPSRKMPGVPDNAFLAEVVIPGSGTAPGFIRLGETKLIKADELTRKIGNLDDKRPTTGKSPLTFKDDNGATWKIKLSGQPVNEKGKQEGIFKAGDEIIELSEFFWKIYEGRHRHSVHPELRTGDLIWLEPRHKDCTRIVREADIKSIQWARWGRRGVALKNLIPSCVLPDSMRGNGSVDMVTDLFGQIPQKGIAAAGPFAARIRPGNLIFFDAKDKTTTETLAPLAAPHPGCIAFYRDWQDLDNVNKESPLKGYKVYRNTGERGENAPWKYSVQGVYGEQGALKPPRQKVNKTAELLNEGLTGKLKISFRALNVNELDLVYAACSVDWKLGGGKPLGLGHCRVTGMRMIDEDGNVTVPMKSPAPGENLELTPEVAKRVKHLEARINLYRASQKPVEKLRYPRAVTKNKNKSSRAGLAWFARHASPRKNGQGLETIWTTGALQQQVRATQIKAQNLPGLNAGNPDADLLYGYDVMEDNVDTSRRNQRMVGQMVKFDPAVHASPDEKAGINTSQNRETRKAQRMQRSSKPGQQSMVDLSITKDNIGCVIAEEFKKGTITSARAKMFLEKMKEFGIKADQSKKWRKKWDQLNKIYREK